MVNGSGRFFNSTPVKLQKSAARDIGTLIAKRRTRRQERMNKGLKKGLITIVCLLALMVTAIPAGAQTRYRRYDGRRYEQRYDGRRYNRDRDWDRSFWDRHRDKLTTAAGAGAGAVIGGIVGGKKGAIIGAIAGGGGAALYTYGIRDKDDVRYRYRNRRRY
jgi:hypothetical protein